MMRHDVNQALLDRYQDPAYLEIGVDEGATFHALRAGKKVGVDPHFKFDIATAKADPANANCEYHPMFSDDYFTKVKPIDEKFDVAFVDGLHTFDQTLRDLLNTVACVRDDGIIIVDDVIPSGYAASIPDLDLFYKFRAATNNPDGSWMGDVFRLVWFIRDYMPFFDYATVLENHGQMILWRASRTLAQPPMNVEAISRLEYPVVPMNPGVFNLKPMAEILAGRPPVTREG